MEAFKFLLIFLLFVLKTFKDVEGDCILSLKSDLGTPSPVLLRGASFLSPDASGAIRLQQHETVTVACPGARRQLLFGNVSTAYEVLEVQCVQNTTFRIDTWTGVFKDIRCNHAPYFTTKLSEKRCYRPKRTYDNGKMYSVGYQIKSRFYPLYEVCFDASLARTSFVKHTLTPNSLFMQMTKRPPFTEGDLFGKIQMSQVYKLNNQKRRLDEILGVNMSAQYITKKQFLSRGHLAPRADFTLDATSRATFHYANAAPQWQRGNAGDWAALEDAIRRRVHSLGRAVSVHTGTHGTLSLPDAQSREQHIYLHTDENNNAQVPVPLYNYKIVYDPKGKKATAFVSINSSFYNSSTIEKLTFCHDVCEDNPNFSWLTWRSNDGTFSFCCSYEEFITKIDYLEKLDVNGLFY